MMGEPRLFSMFPHSALGTEQAGVDRSKRIHSAGLRRTPMTWRSRNLFFTRDLTAHSAHSATLPAGREVSQLAFCFLDALNAVAEEANVIAPTRFLPTPSLAMFTRWPPGPHFACHA